MVSSNQGRFERDAFDELGPSDRIVVRQSAFDEGDIGPEDMLGVVRGDCSLQEMRACVDEHYPRLPVAICRVGKGGALDLVARL